MIAFLDSWVYYISFLIALIIFCVLVRYQKSALIIHQSTIAATLALIQGIILIFNTTFSIVNKLWFGMLMHDLCPLVSYFSIIFFIINRKNLYKMIMPWLLIGSTMTILTGEAPFFSEPKYLLTYSEHMTMFVQGFFAYLWVKKYQKKDYWLVLILPVILILWNYLSAFLPWQLTGNLLWANPSNGMFIPSTQPGANFEILGFITFMVYPWPTITFYILALGVAYLICLNKNYFPNYYAKFKKAIVRNN